MKKYLLIILSLSVMTANAESFSSAVGDSSEGQSKFNSDKKEHRDIKPFFAKEAENKKLGFGNKVGKKLPIKRGFGSKLDVKGDKVGFGSKLPVKVGFGSKLPVKGGFGNKLNMKDGRTALKGGRKIPVKRPGAIKKPYHKPRKVKKGGKQILVKYRPGYGPKKPGKVQVKPVADKPIDIRGIRKGDKVVSRRKPVNVRPRRKLPTRNNNDDRLAVKGESKPIVKIPVKPVNRPSIRDSIRSGAIKGVRKRPAKGKITFKKQPAKVRVEKKSRGTASRR